VPALSPAGGALKRVGHKGADALAPGNTPASFEAALRVGVDAIEFDVLRLRDGGPVIAHDPEDAARREPLTLDEGLDLLAGEAYAGIELDVDMKLPGLEREVVDGLRARGLVERTLVSSMYLRSLDLVGELEPALRRGWSVPRVRRDYTRRRWAIPAYFGARYLRARLPAQAARVLAAGRCHAVIAHWMLVSAPLLRAVRSGGGELWVWTVDERARLERLAALGVDAVITNDPRLFGPPAAGPPGPPEGRPPPVAESSREG
jgi:glycerophosphoryl diester phosphodiesterase